MLRSRLLCLALLCLSVRLAAQSTPNRITAPIDETHLVALHGNVPPLAQTRFDRGPAPVSLPTGRVALILGRSAAQQQALTQFLADVQNPSSPEFHHWLNPAQYGERFGPSDADVQTVESWLQSHGFAIDKVAQARNFLQFSGTIEQIEDAFHTSIHTFSIGGATHYANVADPQIPAALAPVVAGITPLDDFHPRPNIRTGVTAHYDPSTGSIQPDLTLFSQTNAPYLFVDPADAATIYDTPNAALNPAYSGSTWDGAGVSIGILGVSDLTLSDIANYRVAFLGETAASVNLPTVIVDGNDPGLVGGAAADEALLDNELAGALAPKAKLDYYTSADTDLASGVMNAYFRALDDNAVSILNISFSGCEAQQGTGGNQALLEAAQQAAAQGISVVVSAGDGGSAGCDDFDTAAVAEDGLGVNGIASTPYTIAVGGTDFDVLASAFSTYVTTSSAGTAPYYRTALGYIPEKPWNESTTINAMVVNNVAYKNGNGATNIIAGGGGASSCVTQSSSGACLGGYSKPAFQTSLTPSDNVRDLPDVSLFASNGFYGAFWVLCSDSASDGNSGQSYTECATTGGQLTSDTSFGGAGGTSASAPAFSGMLALVAQSQGGERLGQADTVLYQLAQSKPSVYHDIATGNNSVPCASGSPNCDSSGFLTGYNAGAGYDLASGLGSVDVAALVRNWSSVSLASTSTSFSIDGLTAAYSGTHGAGLIFKTSVTGNSGGTPTGIVAILDSADQTPGGTASGPQNNGQFVISLKNGSGSGMWNGLPGGSYTVTARYAGDTANAASTSNPISVTIAPEPSTTTLAVNAVNPLTGAVLTNLGNIPYGSQLVMDAEITGTAEGSKTQGLATGTVTFTNGSTALGTANVSSQNTASWPPLSSAFQALTPGAYAIAAQYSGDASFEPSNATAAFTIAKAPTTIAVSDNTTTVSVEAGGNANVTLTTPWNLGAPPSGNVTMTANGVQIGVINLAVSTQGSGAARAWVLTGQGFIDGTRLAPGNNVVTLAYGGDANYSASSTTLTLDNISGVGSFALTSSGDVSVTAGSNVLTYINIVPAGGFTSPVHLSCTVAGPVTCQLPAAPPTIDSPSTLPIWVELTTTFTAASGTYPVTITGVDDTGKLTASTSFNITINALPANAGLTITNPGPVTVTAGNSTNDAVEIIVAPVNGYIGTVNFTCSVTTTMSDVSSPPTCPSSSFTVVNGGGLYENFVTTTATTPGSYTVTATVTDQLNPSITASSSFSLTVNPPLNPAIALSSSGAITVNPGATTGNASTISVAPSGGFTGQVNLACSITASPAGANDPPACTVSTPVIITGTTAATATLTVTTTAAISSALDPPRFFLAGGGAAFALVVFFGIPARRRSWRALFSFLAIVVFVSAIGCGGSSGTAPIQQSGPVNPGTTPGAYTVTVTGTDAATGTITSSTTVALTVN